MDCPTCGKSLQTEQGMRQHHTKVHGEPLPNRVCSGCGSVFYDPKARREYCDDCNPNAGEHNGNWSGGKETTSCDSCGETFSYYPSDKDGVYCPDCVEDAIGLLPENPSAKGARVTVECGACGSDLEVRPAKFETQERGFFCTLECYGEWLSANVVGPEHHQWEGGTIEYGRKWWRIRRQALERDDYECQHCGAGLDELGQNPDVHHVRAVRSFDRPEDAHKMDNVVTLCRSCHRRAEAGSIAVSPRDEK
ncbi:HNH endonuclease [Halopiger aswanensis]|uniref:HNH endonuclease n=1 Tax=Halopiger aswanensis TaxID=148449 RepID=A0A3R7HIW7_9EURY|nr:HNH endonuclease [Halopiger aswanensis]RKD95481.1 HNH endonuclease [Halopiger aswanensis]